MKIVFIIPRLHQGGSQRQIAETARVLKRHGYDVAILVFNLEGQHFFMKDENIPIIPLNSANLWTRCRSLFLALREANADFAISFLEKANLCLGMVGLFSNLRRHTVFIGSERNSMLRYSRSVIARILFRTAYLGIDALFTNSEQAVSHILSCLGWKKRNIFVLPNLINLEQFQPLPQTKNQLLSSMKSPLSPHDFIILVPARLCKQKNQLILLYVAQILHHQEERAFRFVLAGNDRGTYARTLKNRIKKLRLSRYFIFLGPVPEKTMTSLYCAADIVLLPSLFEGLPNAVMESMACGAVTVGSSAANVTTLIESGKNGFIIPPDDPKKIAETIRSISQMSEERRRLIAKEARETILPYRTEIYVTQLINILASIKPRNPIIGVANP